MHISEGLHRLNEQYVAKFREHFGLFKPEDNADARLTAQMISASWCGDVSASIESAMSNTSVVAVLIENAAERFDDLAGRKTTIGQIPGVEGLHPYASGLLDNGALRELTWTAEVGAGNFPALSRVSKSQAEPWLCARVAIGTGIGVALRAGSQQSVSTDAELGALLESLATPFWRTTANQNLATAMHNAMLVNRTERLSRSLKATSRRITELRLNLEDASVLNSTMAADLALRSANRDPTPSGPALSYVVIGYEMDREIDRTVRSALPPYQQGIEEGDVEVVVVDNGSPEPLVIDPALLDRADVTLIRLEPEEAGLAKAMNIGAAHCRAPNVAMMIDGAHMLSPGVSKWALIALQTFREPIVALQRFFLGDVQQPDAGLVGYDQRVEDEMLDAIDWMNNGYDLFGCSVLVGDLRLKWEAPLFESNCLIMPRAVFDEIGGADIRFTDPAGGFLNLELFNRALGRAESDYVLLAGEASFHQFHGGTTMNAERDDRERKVDSYREEYLEIFGTPYRAPSRPPILLGPAGPPMLNARPFSAHFAEEHQRMGRQMLGRLNEQHRSQQNDTASK